MGSASGMIWRGGGLTALVLIACIGQAVADVTTERGSSILIFPKVMSDETGVQAGAPVETLIQISNTSNSMVFAHCFYLNASPDDPSRPPSATNLPRWQEIDFGIFLTKQQPTHWVVGAGRPYDPSDRQCSRTFSDCNNAGFDPDRVPPMPDPFVGELKCIEVDSAGAPINGNHLKGEATLITPAGDVSKYNAIGVLGLNTDTNSNNSDTTLCLGGGVTAECPGGAEYNACPQTVILNHFAEGATDPVIDNLGNGPSAVETELTLVPCREDFENQIAQSVVVQFKLTNEFEELFSASTTVTCWGNFRLLDAARVFDVGFLGSRFVQTRMTPGGEEQSGFVGVAEEFHFQPARQPNLVSRAALNLHGEGERARTNIIRIPEGP